MFDIKKIFSPRIFLATLDAQKFSWHVGLMTFAALLVSIALSTLVFFGFGRLSRFGGLYMPAYGLAITFFGSIAIVRTLLIRLLVSLGIGYALSEFHAGFKRSKITKWQVVNTYFYAMLIMVCVQMVLFIVVAVLSLLLGSFLLGAVGILFTGFYHVGAIGLAAYWLYGAYHEALHVVDSESHPTTSGQEGVVEGEVVGGSDKKNGEIR